MAQWMLRIILYPVSINQNASTLQLPNYLKSFALNIAFEKS